MLPFKWDYRLYFTTLVFLIILVYFINQFNNVSPILKTTRKHETSTSYRNYVNPVQNNCDELITVQIGGRFGNQMSEYSILYGHAKRLNVSLALLRNYWPTITASSDHNVHICCPYVRKFIWPSKFSQKQTNLHFLPDCGLAEWTPVSLNLLLINVSLFSDHSCFGT